MFTLVNVHVDVVVNNHVEVVVMSWMVSMDNHVDDVDEYPCLGCGLFFVVCESR